MSSLGKRTSSPDFSQAVPRVEDGPLGRPPPFGQGTAPIPGHPRGALDLAPSRRGEPREAGAHIRLQLDVYEAEASRIVPRPQGEKDTANTEYVRLDYQDPQDPLH
jgi:hypothetical protein